MKLDPRTFALSMTWIIAGVSGVGLISVLLLWLGPGALGVGERALERAVMRHGLAVNLVTVDGRVRSDRDAVLRALGDPVGRSILHLDLASARSRVEALPWVNEAAIRRMLPDRLHVTLRERRPGALWSVDGALRIVDEGGVLIDAPSDPERDAALPLMVGAGADRATPELLALLDAHPDLAARFDWAERIGERRWNIKLRRGPTLILPADDPVDAVRGKYAAAESRGLLTDDVEALDLRYDKDFVVRGRQPGLVRTNGRDI